MARTRRSTNNPSTSLRAGKQPTTNNRGRQRNTAVITSASAPRASFAQEATKPRVSKKAIIVVLVVLAIIALGNYKKQWIIAATVNGSPIFNTEVLGRLNKQFREQTLSQMINEKIILNEAKKQGVVVSKNEVDERIVKIEQEVGGAEALDSLLVAQRQTRNDLVTQMRLQLIIEKLYAHEATVAAEEIDKFLVENKGKLVATEAAAQRKEAEERFKQQKLSTTFNEKFQILKEQAKITIF